MTSAVVVVERTADATEGARAEASARFVRVAAGASVADALRAIGAALELPARGTCAGVTSHGDGVAGASPAPVVELVDVGWVSLAAGGVETHLAPRRLPDVTDVVSGVVYARTADPAILPAATEYVAHVGGGASVLPFDVTAIAPADPSTIRIGGEDEGVVVASGTSVDFAWPADGTDDTVYVDVQPGGARCVLGDGTGVDPGHASIPASLLNDTGTMVVHRLHREAVRARGLEAAEIRFDFARSVAYVRP